MANNPMLSDADKMIACADLLRESCDRMAARRLKAFLDGQIDEPEFRVSVADEGLVRQHVSEMVLQAIRMAIQGVEDEQEALEDAIRGANAAIRKIAEIRAALLVFAAVIGLSEAIALGKPAGILKAVKALKASVPSDRAQAVG